MNLLEEALEDWEDVRLGVIAEAENIPEEQYDFAPEPSTRSVAELLRHIMEVSMMMATELTRSETNLRRASFPELISPYAQHLERMVTKEQLVKALQWTLEDGLERFRKRGEPHILELMTRFDGKQATRLAWLHHGISQEMYHRGQLATYQRLMKIEPALTKLIRGGS